MSTAELQAYVERIVATWPPLTTEQCARIAATLRGGAA